MVYACFTKYRAVTHGKNFWGFEYLAFSEQEKDQFVADVTEKMQGRMLGMQPIGYRTVLLEDSEGDEE